MPGLVTPGPKTPAPHRSLTVTRPPEQVRDPRPFPTHEPPEPAPTVGRNRPWDRPECRLGWRMRLLLKDSCPRPLPPRGRLRGPPARGAGPAPGAPHPTLFTCPQSFPRSEKRASRHHGRTESCHQERDPRAVLACVFSRPSPPPDGASPQQSPAQCCSDSLPGPSAGWGWAEMLPPPNTQGSSWLHAGCWASQCPTEKERDLHPERVQSKRCWRRLGSASVVRGAWSRPWSLLRQVPAREPGGFLPAVLVRPLSPRLRPSDCCSSTETPAVTGPGGSQGSRAVLSHESLWDGSSWLGLQ